MMTDVSEIALGIAASSLDLADLPARLVALQPRPGSSRQPSGGLRLPGALTLAAQR